MEIVDESRDTNSSILNMVPGKNKNDINIMIDPQAEGMSPISSILSSEL